MAKIREFAHGDLPEALHILSQSQLWVADPAVAEAALREGNSYIAEEGSVPVGVVSFVADPVFAAGGCLRFVAVHPEKRRRGIGRQLMGFVERKVFARSPNLYISCPCASEPAFHFFQKLGYRKVGEIPDFTAPGQIEWILQKTSRDKHDRQRQTAAG